MIVVKDGQVYQTPDVTETLNALKSKMTYAEKLDQEAAEKYQKPIEIEIVGDLPEFGSISADAKVRMQSMLEGVNAKTVISDFGSAAAGVATDIKDAATGAVDKITGGLEDTKDILILGALGLAVLLIVTR